MSDISHRHKKQRPGACVGQVQILFNPRHQWCRYDPGAKVKEKNRCQNKQRTQMIKKGNGGFFFISMGFGVWQRAIG